jgi:hypothetical protein
MPIALSLMFPFAEAAGITLTGLGIAKATDVIMNYIQANPEKSKQILSTLSPLIGGLGSILTNKESKGVLSPEEEKIFKEAAKDSAARGPETIETTPEQQPRLTGKEKGQRIKDAIRRAKEGKGNYSSPDAVGPAVDIRGSVIREVEDMGMASKKRKPVNPNPEEDKTEYGGPSLTEEFRQLGRDRGSNAEFKELARLAKKIREGKADGGRIGYAPGGLATTQDYANALQRVGAGTAEQKRTSVNDYAQNEAYGLLNNAMSSQSGLTDLYNNYIKGQGGLSSNAFGFGRDAATSQTASTFDPKYKQQVLDQIAYKIQQSANNNITYKPLQKTYRSHSPEAQALNMDQSTYENIISMGADPKQYYMDYQNRMMTAGQNYGTPGTSSYVGPALLKYGQVAGGPGTLMGMGNNSNMTQAEMEAQAQALIGKMQNNPQGFQNFDDVVKYYGSNDPYMSQKQEIKDMVKGVDTGYMSGQDYYDQRVLGLDGQGIAEKYGLQYGTGGRVGYNQGGLVTMFVEKR